jgi:hypothetical protein
MVFTYGENGQRRLEAFSRQRNFAADPVACFRKIVLSRSYPIFVAAALRAPMFQYINGTIECGECRHDIRHGEEFNCSTCGASLCESCVIHHEDECAMTVGEV